MIRDKLSLPSLNSIQSDDDDTEGEEGEGKDHQTRSFQVTVDYETSEDEPGTIPEIHQTLVAPSDITEKPAAVRTGDRWTRTLWAGEYPEAPMDGFLEKLYAAAETRTTDIAIHIDPRDTRETLDTLENRIEDLQADYEYLTEKHRASARGVEKDLSDHEEMYDVLRNTSMEAFDVSAYLAVRGDERDDIDATDVMATARRAPANLTPVAPRWSQLDALISCSPVATDRLAETLDAKTPMLGGAVGAMFPFVSGAFAEPGIEYGTYALNSSPLILDRFERETGYCAMVIGRLGAGKSFATKLRLVRRAMYDEDTIIVALWDATDPTTPWGEEGDSDLSFSELRDRVGVQDSGQFNYHLDKLTGTFVEQTDGTYTLTTPANRILSAIIAGAVTDPPSFTDEPIDTDCYYCGGSVVIDYIDGVLRVRCTNCEGGFRKPDDPPGLLETQSRSPTGLTNRSPQEFFRQGNVVSRHNRMSYMEGACPNCTGTVTPTVQICDNHEPGDDSLCPHCRQTNKIGWNFVCDVCKGCYTSWGRSPIFTEMAVLSFCYERGLDVYTIHDTAAWRHVNDAFETTVSSRDPLEITVTIELEGDRLTVTLDDDANVVDIEETTGVA